MEPSLRLIVNTGNIFNLDIIKTNAIVDPNEEFLEGMRQIFLTSPDEKGHLEQMECSNKKLKCLSTDENIFSNFDRSQLKLSVKLFIYPKNSTVSSSVKDFTDETIRQAVNCIRKLLHTETIDQLNISVQTSDEDVLMEYLQASWNTAETVTPPIGSLGTSDLNAEQLQHVINFFNTKPSTNHINLDGCCDIPADLNELSKANNIQLLIHNDPLENYIPVERLQSLFTELKQDPKTSLCTVMRTLNPQTIVRSWIARYSVVHESQGLIVSKGYLASLASFDS